jgi:hypothetical protein
MQHFDTGGKWDILVVWAFSLLSWLTMSNLVGFFAIVASIMSIIKSAPAVIAIIKKYIKK